MIRMERSNKLTEDFNLLDNLLDEDYYERFGEISLEYKKYNTLERVTGFVLAYDGATPVACGCIRQLGPETAELKRIFVRKEYRRRKIASRIIEECEEMARDEGFDKIALQTGAVMDEAITLYKKHGYEMVANYGEFAGDERSVCMEKPLR